MKKIIKIFLLLIVEIFVFSLWSEESFLNLSIESFKKGNVDLSKKYLSNAVLKDTTIQNNKDYLKIQYIIHFIEKNDYVAEQYYQILEPLDIQDDFLFYIRILQLLNLNKYQEIFNLLNRFSFEKEVEESFTILPFACTKENNLYLFEQKLKQKHFSHFWRNHLTKKEKELILLMQNIFNRKDTENTLSQIQKCLSYNQNNFIFSYHLYRFLIIFNNSLPNLYQFYEFLYQNQRYLEALHVLRVLYTNVRVQEKEFYVILLNFKKVYEKLNYTPQVDSIDRFLRYMEKMQFKNYDFIELKKIASENYKLREFLVFLYQNTDNPEKKEFFLNKLYEYDSKYDYKEKISFYKTIYKY